MRKRKIPLWFPFLELMAKKMEKSFKKSHLLGLQPKDAETLKEGGLMILSMIQQHSMFLLRLAKVSQRL